MYSWLILSFISLDLVTFQCSSLKKGREHLKHCDLLDHRRRLKAFNRLGGHQLHRRSSSL